MTDLRTGLDAAGRIQALRLLSIQMCLTNNVGDARARHGHGRTCSRASRQRAV